MSNEKIYVLGRGFIENGLEFVRAESEDGAKEYAREEIEDTDKWFVVTTVDKIEEEVEQNGHYSL